MTSNKRVHPITLLNVAAVALFAATFVTTVYTQAPPAKPATAKPATTQAPAAPQAPATPPADYAGADTCIVCHEGYDTQLKGTKHGLAKDARTPMAKMGCESCHGPGKAHTEDPTKVKPRQFNKLSAKEVTDVCATCHNKGPHALWKGSQHEARNVSCTTCHTVHHTTSMTAQLKAESQQKLCVNCHADKVAKLDRSGHMPVREGKMECTSCHNPHGSTNVRLLRTGNSINEACSSCHAEKRGPFLFEHAGITGESCATCHDPHGSSNDRMLVAKLPFLCQRCHNHAKHPATIYDNKVTQSSNRLFSRSCVTCHSAIHGSNHPAGATFLRQ